MFHNVAPTVEEIAALLPGDAIVRSADVVMDRAFSVPGTREQVWPWLMQLGKGRAGWYFPRGVEWFIPPSRRGAREIVPQWQDLRAGDVIPDYGRRDATFEVTAIEAPSTLVYRSRRGRTDVSWSINLTPEGMGSRVHLRLRLGQVRHRRLAERLGGGFDGATIAGLAAGLRERVGSALPR